MPAQRFLQIVVLSVASAVMAQQPAPRLLLPPLARSGGALTAVRELPDGRLLLITAQGAMAILGEGTRAIHVFAAGRTIGFVPEWNGRRGVFALAVDWSGWLAPGQFLVNRVPDPYSVLQIASTAANPAPGAGFSVTVGNPESTPFGSPLAISPDGRWAVAQVTGASVGLFDLGKTEAAANSDQTRPPRVAEWALPGAAPVSGIGFAFAPDSSTLFAVDPTRGAVYRYDVASRQELPGPAAAETAPSAASVPPRTAGVWGLSADGGELAWTRGRILNRVEAATGAARASIALPGEPSALAAGGAGAFYVGLPDGSIWVAQGGAAPRWIASLHQRITALFFAPGHQVLAASTQDDLIHILTATGTELFRLALLPQEESRVGNDHPDDWLVAAPSGRFDGSDQRVWIGARWQFGEGRSAVAVPIEAYMDEYFTPGLAGRLLAGESLPAPKLVPKETRTPLVTLSQSAPAAAGKTRLRITVTAPAGVQARDLHLERNGVLLHTWPGPFTGAAGYTADLVYGANQFTAFAFNQDRVQSPSSSLQTYGRIELQVPGDLYVVAIGIDQYHSPKFRLHYAAGDALLALRALRAQHQILARNYAGLDQRLRSGMVFDLTAELPKLAAAGALHGVTLLDRQATRANILAALRRVAEAARPQDSILIFYAGHGAAQGQRYYLIPADYPFTGSPDDPIARTTATLARGAVSDLDLATALGADQAQVSAIILDSCEAGAALGAPGRRPGASDSPGLAQLAYDKGIYVLAGALATQNATERDSIRHGLLSYALFQEGLFEDRVAADDSLPGSPTPPGGARPVTLRQWLDWAVERVPQLSAGQVQRGFPTSILPPRGQQPRLFAATGAADLAVAAQPITPAPAPGDMNAAINGAAQDKGLRATKPFRTHP